MPSEGSQDSNQSRPGCNPTIDLDETELVAPQGQAESAEPRQEALLRADLGELDRQALRAKRLADAAAGRTRAATHAITRACVADVMSCNADVTWCDRALRSS